MVAVPVLPPAAVRIAGGLMRALLPMAPLITTVTVCAILAGTIAAAFAVLLLHKRIK